MQGAKVIEEKRVIGEERDCVLDAGAEAVEAGAGELEFDVVAGFELGGVGLHGAGPLVDEGGVGDVDEDGLSVARFGVGGDGVEEEEVDGVGWEVAEGFVFDAGVAGEAGGGLGEGAEGGVVGVLVFDEGGGEEDGGFYFADGGGEF